jgi:hypothetical protein
LSMSSSSTNNTTHTTKTRSKMQDTKEKFMSSKKDAMALRRSSKSVSHNLSVLNTKPTNSRTSIITSRRSTLS